MLRTDMSLSKVPPSLASRPCPRRKTHRTKSPTLPSPITPIWSIQFHALRRELRWPGNEVRQKEGRVDATLTTVPGEIQPEVDENDRQKLQHKRFINCYVVV